MICLLRYWGSESYGSDFIDRLLLLLSLVGCLPSTLDEAGGLVALNS